MTAQRKNDAAEARADLIVVGTGLRAHTQITLGALEAIRAADKLLFAVADSETGRWLTELNASAEPLPYDTTQPRRRAVYEQMVHAILGHVQRGLRVCAAFYGHPGVFAFASHEAIRRARRQGFSATMLPGVSAEDCLLAELGVDPAALGCQSYEATDFLIRPRNFDTSTALLLWQVGNVGNLGFGANVSRVGLSLLADTLNQRYGAEHRAYLYESGTDRTTPSRIEPVLLGALVDAPVALTSTLFVPAKAAAPVDARTLALLGLDLG